MRGHIYEHSFLLIVFFSWCFALTDAEVKDERVRQTFVVRYKNGEQTIPVTVVLDYKKQTEYVINMHPRSPAKSVTLYDFKQRTIAFKDLTNRECFLGHLTHETINHEREALHEVKSPVQRNPKILSLDPQRPALTPTEIRNLAGQKTAVFCRKMNTWLLMPDTAHNVKKRDVDEVEERTYGHHGYHTVQYSHYGHETIRRYRNRSRSSTRHQQHRKQNAVENENLKSSESEPVPPFERHTVPHRASNVFPFRSNHGIHHHSNLENSNGNSYDRKMSILENSPKVSSAGSHGNTKDDHHSADKSASGSHNLNSFSSNDHDSSNESPNINTKFGYRIKSPGNFEAEFASSFADKGHLSNILGPTFNPSADFKSNKEETSRHFPEPNGRTALINKVQSETLKRTAEEEATTKKSRFIRRTERDSGNVAIPTVPYSLENENKYFDLSKPSSSHHIPDERQRSLPIHSLPWNRKAEGHGSRRIETESFSGEILPPLDNNTFKEPIIKYENTDYHSLPTPWNVSTDVSEVPKEASKFETIKLDESSISNPKPNHRVGGLFDSRGNQPVLEHGYFFDSYNHENGNARDRNNLINSGTSSVGNPHKFHRYDGKAETYLNENHPRFALSRIPTNPTEFPAIRAPIYDEFKPEPTSNYLHSYTTSDRKPANSESKLDTSHLAPNSEQGTNFNPYQPSGSDGSSVNYAVQGNTFSDENFLGIIPRGFETTESYFPFQEKKPHLRSDIPSEDRNNDPIVETISFSSAGRDAVKNSDPSQGSNTSSNDSLVHQVRYQNVLRHFKPDEIIIDVAKIPTQPPPDTTSSFLFESTTTHLPPRRPATTQTPFRNIIAAHTPFRSVTTTQIPLRPSFTNRLTGGRRGEQVFGATYRSSYDVQPTRQPKRRVNNHSQPQFPPGVTFHVRKNVVPPYHRLNESQQNVHSQSINRHRQHVPPVKPSSGFSGPIPRQYHVSQPFNQQPFNPSLGVNHQHQVPLPQIINSLPPGVSMHPRHPQSPYADMIHSNRPPPLPQGADHRVPPKPHRQRHHRKKERVPNSCCRVNGKPNSLLSCCRSGGHCCSGVRNGGQQHPRAPCCSTNKTIPNRQVVPRNHHEQPVRNSNRSQQTSKMFVDNRDRCQKEKMCRTVYESTQQVMVCRQADIEGC